MTTRASDAETARSIMDANNYMVIGSADVDGTPWATPVYFTAYEYRELYWVSHPDARHSENVAVRPDVGIVVFDSQVAPGNGQAVYMAAHATELTDTPDFETGLERFNYARYAEPTEHGLSVFGPERVLPPANLRLYRATVSQHFVLEPDVDRRVAVEP